MPILPFGEFRSDVADVEANHSRTITNVLPRADGYGPFKSFVDFTAALAAVCRGMFFARKNDGAVAIFAGTSTKLYLLNNTDFTWTDVSKASGTYSALSATHQWQFAQFGNIVLTTQANAVIQSFDLTSSTEFADLAGTPPQASYIAVVGRFVVLSGLLNNPYRVHWSGLNAITTWTSGTNQSDFQDLPDGGIVRGVAGGEYGVIFQDGAMRRMTYAPGSPVIFQIDRISEDIGLYAPYSIIRAGERVFFCSPQGFKMLLPGGLPIPIGKEKIDRTFFDDVDESNIHLIIGASDPKNNRVFTTYKSLAGQMSAFNKILCYDWVLDRWTVIEVVGEYLATIARPGVTLEGLDAISSSIDALPFSLDSVSTGSFPQIGMVDSLHKMGFFTGTNLEATLETAERSGDGRRVFVRGFRPVTDAPTCYGSVSKRENLQTAETHSSEVLINSQGLVPARISTRHMRAKIRIPAETIWTFALGVEPDIILEGKR